MTKHQRQPSDAHSGPRSRMPSSWKKRKDRFKSSRMKKINSQVERSRLNYGGDNANRGGNDVVDKSSMYNGKKFDSKKVNKKDQQDNDSKQQTTSRLDEFPISSSRNIKRVYNSIHEEGFLTEDLVNLVPMRPKDQTTLGCTKDSHLLKEKEILVLAINNIKISNSQPHHMKAMPRLVHKKKSVDELNQCNNVLVSGSKGRSNLNYEEDFIVGEGNVGRLTYINSQPLHTTLKGPNISLAKEFLVPNKEPVSRSDKDKEIQGHTSAPLLQGIMSGEVNFMCDDHHKQVDFVKAKEAPNSSSMLKGNQVMQNPQSNSDNISFPIFGKDLSSHQRAMASCMDDNMEWNGDPSDGCIQLDDTNRSTKFAEGVRAGDVKLKRESTGSVLEKQHMAHFEDNSEHAENSRPMNIRRRHKEKDHRRKVSMPSVSDSVKQQCYSYSQPIDEPIWSGIFKVGSKKYVSLAAHLSTKSCEEVWISSRSLQPVVKVTMLPRSEVWPKRWETSRPTDGSIGLYFFPCKMGPDEDLDQLVKEVIENDYVLRAVIGEAEMLIFPSILLPEPYQTFQSKHYLWGVFKRRNGLVSVVKEHHGEEEMEKQHVSHQQDEGQCVELDHEPLMKRTVRLKRRRLSGEPRGVEKEAVETSTRQAEASCADAEPKAPEEANMQDVEKELTPSLAGSNAPSSLAERVAEATSAPTTPATTSDQVHAHPRFGVPSGRMVAFVVGQKTSRLEKLIREMEREGAFVLAVQGEMIGSRFGQATAVQ